MQKSRTIRRSCGFVLWASGVLFVAQDFAGGGVEVHVEFFAVSGFQFYFVFVAVEVVIQISVGDGRARVQFQRGLVHVFQWLDLAALDQFRDLVDADITNRASELLKFYKRPAAVNRAVRVFMSFFPWVIRLSGIRLTKAT
jgi:hypothetical protein